MSDPAFSVITASFNAEKFLPECLTSVREQNSSEPALGHIVIDGASTDGTVDLLKEWQNQSNIESLAVRTAFDPLQQHPSSTIPEPASSSPIQHPTSKIPEPSSNIQHPTSNTHHPSSIFHHPFSFFSISSSEMTVIIDFPSGV